MAEPWVFPVAGLNNWSDTWGAARDGGARTHKGQDVFAAKGTPVVAVVSGRAVAGSDHLGGTTVTLHGDDGRRYYYAHLSATAPKLGRVTAGTVLGRVGNTGNASKSSPHLHFGVYEGAKAINPLALLKGSTMGASGGVPAAQTVPAQAISLPGAGNQGLQSAYGWASVFADVPELKAILTKAAAGNWTPDVIEAAVRNSNFYKQRNSNQIQWEVERRLHPKDVDQKRNDLTRSVQQMATKMGFTITPERANTVSGYALAMGWTDSQIEDAVGREFNFDPKNPQGDAGKLLSNLKQTAHRFFMSVPDAALDQWVEGIVRGTLTEGGFETFVREQAKRQHPEWIKAIDAGMDPKEYLDQSSALTSQFRQASKNFFVPLSDGALKNWVDNILLGTSTQDNFDEYIKQQAISMFPQMKAAIEQGFDMKTIADPYVQIAAQELNIPDTSVNFTDPKWLEALVQTDPKTGERMSMSLDNWRTHLRMDPKYGWNSTMGAVNKAAEFADKLSVEMGAVAH